MIGGGEVFNGDGGTGGAGKFGQHGTQIIKGALEGDVLQFESGFPANRPELCLGGLDGGTTDVKIPFQLWEPVGRNFQAPNFLIVFKIG